MGLGYHMYRSEVHSITVRILAIIYTHGSWISHVQINKLINRGHIKDIIIVPWNDKANILQMRKQRRRSASQ